MEEELKQLKEMLTQLRAENQSLREERRDSQSHSSHAVSDLPPQPPLAQSSSNANANASASERLVFVPSVRKCPYFSGRSDVNINEWIEEAQTCMRTRCLTTKDQAFFLFDHLEGEAREEIRYRPAVEREDPNKIIAILRDLYGCSQSYVALQEAFFCRKQQDGETLQEFSLALMSLMERVKQRAPATMLNAEALLRDQFTEHVLDNSLRRELKQLVRRCPTSTLLEIREDAIRWEREGMPGGARGRSNSVPAAYGTQYAVHGGARPAHRDARPAHRDSPQSAEFTEVMDMLKRQQEQLNQLTQTVASLKGTQPSNRPPRSGPVICWRCQQPGHLARECEAPERSSYSQRSSTAGPPLGRDQQAPAPGGNWHPPNC